MALLPLAQRWLLLLLLAWLPYNHTASARLTATWNGTTLNVPSMDYFMHRTPYYERDGAAILWPWINDGTSCTMRSIPANQTNTESMVINAARYQDTAFVVYWQTAFTAGCKTLAQVGLAAQKAGEQLQQLGYPPLRLIIMLFFSNDTTPIGGPNTLMYRSADTSVPDGPPVVNMMLLDQWDSLRFYQRFRSVPFVMNFKAVEEPGAWNAVFLSTAYTVYTWIIFAMVLVATIFTLMRFARSLILRELPCDLRLAVMILTFIYCVFLLAYYVVTNMSLVGRVLEYITMFLSVLSLELILWHWTTLAKNILPRVTIVFFLACIALHMLLMLGLFVFNCYLAFQWQYRKLDATVDALSRYMVPIVPLLGLIIFCGFGIWFGLCAYRVRRKPKARSRSLQLTLFSVLTAATFASAAVMNIVIGLGPARTDSLTIMQTLSFDIATLTSYAVRALVCLAVTAVSCSTAGVDASSQPSITSTSETAVPKPAVSWSDHAWSRLESALRRNRN
ncbi:hypothetical protein THASP1DRAFT_32090 [Thamnocephalis sphaerospora]|uniref:Lung seven transmembrane receptor-domain-containing protein n=1 Tax=Thamnocephalis sphaerospora TaxID=78915 RepID=A0A4P9XKV5_9FUNG|nr:hypothetical protein THASP1DRAFT_32090 [Thamnocephalis sphaerospora]|eukprot:RKP06081.1 hypothetical protein THASP1DRAFT_32090 [Thamnocephalis sphaerospora]